ncbi:MAG: hypothetical protein DRQ88_05890 [Epsilonproteobacteria bacterium]|nr:MAG: hypothetical protein DRQ88_05890 [Campylobacterota bacterium]
MSTVASTKIITPNGSWASKEAHIRQLEHHRRVKRRWYRRYYSRNMKIHINRISHIKHWEAPYIRFIFDSMEEDGLEQPTDWDTFID